VERPTNRHGDLTSVGNTIMSLFLVKAVHPLVRSSRDRRVFITGHLICNGSTHVHHSGGKNGGAFAAASHWAADSRRQSCARMLGCLRPAPCSNCQSVTGAANFPMKIAMASMGYNDQHVLVIRPTRSTRNFPRASPCGSRSAPTRSCPRRRIGTAPRSNSLPARSQWWTPVTALPPDRPNSISPDTVSLPRCV
jgi:hypothetical protein